VICSIGSYLSLITEAFLAEEEAKLEEFKRKRKEEIQGINSVVKRTVFSLELQSEEEKQKEALNSLKRVSFFFPFFPFLSFPFLSFLSSFLLLLLLCRASLETASIAKKLLQTQPFLLRHKIHPQSFYLMITSGTSKGWFFLELLAYPH